MCQYFWKPAGKTIDEEKLRNSVINNPHGWGLLYRDDPKNKDVNPFEFLMCEDPDKNTDPDEIVKLVNEKLKDKDVYLHLRWVTAGDRSVENIHPFSVLERGRKQLFLMHNGTITKFKPKGKDTRSDTRIFTDKVMTPLASVMKNPFKWGSWTNVSEIIYELIGDWSRVMLISSMEKVPLLFNYDNHYFERDKDGKGLWISSNEYSFDPDHRKPKTTVYNTGFHAGHKTYYPVIKRSKNGSFVWYEADVTVGDTTYRYYRTFTYSKKNFEEAERNVPETYMYFGNFKTRKGETFDNAMHRILKEINKDYYYGYLCPSKKFYAICDTSEIPNSKNTIYEERDIHIYVDSYAY